MAEIHIIGQEIPITISQPCTALLAALAAARKEIPAIPMRGWNPHFKSEYVELSDVLDTVNPILEKHGLLATQFPINCGPYAVGVYTIIFHVETGEYIGGGAGLPLGEKASAQNATAAITYARRSSLCAVLQIVGDKDDDGNNAEGRTSKPVPASTPKAATKPATKETAKKAQAENKAAMKPPAAEIPSEPLGGKPEGTIPVQGEFNKLRDRALKIGQRLFEAKLITQPNRKIRAYLLSVTGAQEPEKLTYAQWNKFFQIVESQTNDQALATTIDEALKEAEAK